MATHDTQVSSYGPISATMQVTQTLPVHTQPSTQLLSHEVPQYTQLIDRDSVEYALDDTLINSGDLEASGNTLVLQDDAFPAKSKSGSSPPARKDGYLQAALPPHAGTIGVSAEDCADINTAALDPPKNYIASNLPDSDATTEEAENDGFGPYVEEADAESLLQTNVDTRGNVAPDPGEQSTLSPSLAAGAASMKSSQSGHRSLQTVPSNAPGHLVANQIASLDSTRMDDAKFASEQTSEVRKCESKDPLHAVDGVLGPTRGLSMSKVVDFDTMQWLPKAMAPPLDATTCSPHVLTSAFLSSEQALEQDPTSSQFNTNESDKIRTGEGLSSHARAPGLLIGHPKSILPPLEPLAGDLKRQHSQEPTKKIDQDSTTNNAGPGVSVVKQPSPQNAHEVVMDKLADSERAVSKILETEGQNANGEFVSVAHAPVKEQRLFLPTNLSYLESQEPGEETQMNAFNMVDKLVWLDTTCMPDDIVTSPAPQDSSIKDHASSKGLRPIAQAAQMKTVRDKLDVFDWQDSQVDQVFTSPDVNQKPVNIRSRKRQSEARRPVPARKKQATSEERRKSTTSQMEKKGNGLTVSAEKEKPILDVAKAQVPNLELSKCSMEKKPHILLTTRLRNRTKAEPRPSEKGRKVSSLKRGSSKHAGKERESDECGRDFDAGNREASDNMEIMVQEAGPNVKQVGGKQGGKKKAVDESGKVLKTERWNGNDNMKAELQQSVPRAKSEARKRTSGKNAIDKVGKDLKTEQPDASGTRGKNSLQTASLRAKSKVELPKNPEASPEGRKTDQLTARTSQDDAAAEIWIEAFSSTKNKTPPKSSDVELVKFQKRKVLHEDTGQDPKKCRIMEASMVDVNDKEEAPLKENRVESDKVQRASKKPEKNDAVKVSRHGGRRASTSPGDQDENQELVKKENNLIKEKRPTTKSRSPRTDATQVETRRISTRSSGGKHPDASFKEDILMEENKAERGSETKQVQEQRKTADVMITPLIKSQRVSTCSSKQEDVKVSERGGNVKKGTTLERDRKTRFRNQRAESTVAGSDVKEGNGVKNDVDKGISAKTTINDKDEQLLPRETLQGKFATNGSVVVEPSVKTRSSKQKEGLFSHQHSIDGLDQDGQEIEAGPCQAGTSLIDVNEGFAEKIPRGRSKRGEDDTCVLKSAKALGKLVPQPKEDADKSKMKIKELVGSERGNMSKPTILRRTRRNAQDGAPKKFDLVDVNVDNVQFHGESPPEEQKPQNHDCILDHNEDLKEEDTNLATKITESVPRQSKKTSVSKRVGKLDSSNKGMRRKTEPGSIRVLFSHSLTEDMIKHQKKILAKLGGQLATSASDCTHFVSNGFVRTQNMLMCMAAGKIVATPLWLENCGQANYFVDARKYILQDGKKEKELGFSMVTSLASAEQKPLLKDVQMLVCPNTAPEPKVLQAIIEVAGGQVVDNKSSSSLLDAKDSVVLSVVIANEKDFDFCLQFLGKGLKVYSEELLLHGIVTQNLDFSRNRLFEDFEQRGGRRRAAKVRV